jgi:DNA-binding transcriptional regulator YdaS (Cro superfamily)
LILGYEASLDLSLKLGFSSDMTIPTEALERAKKAAGGPAALARELGITAQAICQWHEVPPLRVLDVEHHTGIPRHELRPDIYPLPARAAE